jgi:hypothetical protein
MCMTPSPAYRDTHMNMSRSRCLTHIIVHRDTHRDRGTHTHTVTVTVYVTYTHTRHTHRDTHINRHTHRRKHRDKFSHTHTHTHIQCVCVTHCDTLCNTQWHTLTHCDCDITMMWYPHVDTHWYWVSETHTVWYLKFYQSLIMTESPQSPRTWHSDSERADSSSSYIKLDVEPVNMSRKVIPVLPFIHWPWCTRGRWIFNKIRALYNVNPTI